MANNVKYPIGQQDFKTLREMEAVYVDKTRYISKILDGGSQYFFLARPRRFGKSLFLSMLQYFFEGRRELFEGLHIDSSEWDWKPYPVLRIDFNTERYAEKGKLEDVVENMFRIWEEQYGIEARDKNHAQRFKNIIEKIHEITKRQVVILVDEYDKPLVGNLNKSDFFEHYRAKLAALYSIFKSSAAHIRLVFLTGVSRFSKLSVFSDLNNLNDITFDNEYADICGISEKELHTNFHHGINALAEKYEMTFDETCMMLKTNYDGYRFAEEGSDMYNPWSLLNCLSKKKIQNYWNETGVPTIVAESLKKVNADLEKIFNIWCGEDELKGLDLQNPQPLALLYQTGYLTIKEYDMRVDRYRLGIPNKEVKKGIYNELLPYYMNSKSGTTGNVVADIVADAIWGRPEDFMRSLQTFFASVSYRMRMDNENNFHNALYLLTRLIGLDTETEVDTSDGSIDMLIKTKAYIYNVELKYDGTAQQALDQINKKQYARPFRNDSRRIFKIGVNFSSKTRCIEDWKI